MGGPFTQKSLRWYAKKMTVSFKSQNYYGFPENALTQI